MRTDTRLNNLDGITGRRGLSMEISRLPGFASLIPTFRTFVGPHVARQTDTEHTRHSLVVNLILGDPRNAGICLLNCAGLQYIVDRYTISLVIRTFRNKDAQALFEGRCPRRWLAIRQTAERKLAQLHAAATPDFLRSPPGNRLETLKGDRAGQWSIRINDQWRVCFRWADGDVYDVEITDYH